MSFNPLSDYMQNRVSRGYIDESVARMVIASFAVGSTSETARPAVGAVSPTPATVRPVRRRRDCPPNLSARAQAAEFTRRIALLERKLAAHTARKTQHHDPQQVLPILPGSTEWRIRRALKMRLRLHDMAVAGGNQ